jgi:hypothetical protein
MRSIAAPILLVLLLLQISSTHLHAQEETDAVIKNGNHYTVLKVKSLNKYNDRIERQQKHLLAKLKKKEQRFSHKLKSADSVAYARYKQQSTPSYDSIANLSHSDTGATAARFSKQKNCAVDSLRGVENFVQSKSGLSANTPSVPGQSAELNQLQGKLNFRSYVTQLITQRTNSLKNLADNSNVPGFTGIEKQVFYGKAKMKVFKDMAEDPTIAEDKAMEYLKGTEGFDKEMSSATQGSGGGSMSGLSSDQLAQAGFQTKQLVQKSLQNSFGTAGLSNISKQVSGEISDWQKNSNDITGNIKQSQQSLQQLRNTGKPSFKVNPMRGLPFWKRIQKQYSWQTKRASADGTQPAMIQPSAMAGYKQSPKLIYGLGIATSIGLGQNWSNVHLSFRGVGLRSFATWQWLYGIGVYTGYERMYDGFSFIQKQTSASTDNITTTHSNANYTESVLVGLTKDYNINKKYNGQIQVLYDIWWQEKGLRSPIVLRFATINK